jgi:putative effector of murein hydrolase LrgA (UPF0299 family)
MHGGTIRRRLRLLARSGVLVRTMSACSLFAHSLVLLFVPARVVLCCYMCLARQLAHPRVLPIAPVRVVFVVLRLLFACAPGIGNGFAGW